MLGASYLNIDSMVWSIYYMIIVLILFQSWITLVG